MLLAFTWDWENEADRIGPIARSRALDRLERVVEEMEDGETGAAYEG